MKTFVVAIVLLGAIGVGCCKNQDANSSKKNGEGKIGGSADTNKFDVKNEYGRDKSEANSEKNKFSEEHGVKTGDSSLSSHRQTASAFHKSVPPAFPFRPIPTAITPPVAVHLAQPHEIDVPRHVPVTAPKPARRPVPLSVPQHMLLPAYQPVSFPVSQHVPIPYQVAHHVPVPVAQPIFVMSNGKAVYGYNYVNGGVLSNYVANGHNHGLDSEYLRESAAYGNEQGNAAYANSQYTNGAGSHYNGNAGQELRSNLGVNALTGYGPAETGNGYPYDSGVQYVFTNDDVSGKQAYHRIHQDSTNQINGDHNAVGNNYRNEEKAFGSSYTGNYGNDYGGLVKSENNERENGYDSSDYSTISSAKP